MSLLQVFADSEIDGKIGDGPVPDPHEWELDVVCRFSIEGSEW